MKEIERRAMLGDEEAQRECTQQGIVLPCPKCYGKVKAYIVRADRVCIDMEYKCQKCGLAVKYTQFFPLDECAAMCATALERWNHRPAPPIGRCKDCAYSAPHIIMGDKKYGTMCKIDPYLVHVVESDGYCDCFKPKEEAK